jgi:hypothetical protein
MAGHVDRIRGVKSAQLARNPFDVVLHEIRGERAPKVWSQVRGQCTVATTEQHRGEETASTVSVHGDDDTDMIEKRRQMVRLIRGEAMRWHVLTKSRRLMYAVVRGIGSLCRESSYQIGAFFKRAAVKGHEPERAAQFHDFFDTRVREEIAQIHVREY